jgi:hypothetical protein
MLIAQRHSERSEESVDANGQRASRCPSFMLGHMPHSHVDATSRLNYNDPNTVGQTSDIGIKEENPCAHELPSD